MLKFGKSTPTFNTPAPIDEATRETLAQRKETTDRINTALRSYHKTLSKQRDVPNEKGTALPIEILGEAMRLAVSGAGHTQQLKHVGTAHFKLAKLTTKFLDDFDNQLRILEAKGLEHGGFVRTLKETDKRRDVYESAITKAKKSKKEDGEDLATARTGYEDYCMTLERKAEVLLAGVEEEQVNLAVLLDLEVDYATEYAKILVEAKKTLPSSSSRHSLKPPLTTRMSRSHSDSALKPDSVPTRQRSSTLTLGSRGEQLKIGEEKVKGRSRSGSLLARFVTKKDEDTAATTTSNFSLPSVASLKNIVGTSKYNSLGESASLTSSSYSSPTAVPRFTRSQTSPSSPTFRPDPPSKSFPPKPSLSTPATTVIGSRFVAKFAFKATDSTELSLEKGDIITVEKVINSDWWEGVIEGKSDAKGGMFPSGFVGVAVEQEDLLMRRSSVKSTSGESVESEGWRGGMSSGADDESEGESYSLKPNNSSQSSDHPFNDPPNARRAPPPPPPPRRYTTSPFAK